MRAGDLDPAQGGQLLELGLEAVVGLLGELGLALLAHGTQATFPLLVTLAEPCPSPR